MYKIWYFFIGPNDGASKRLFAILAFYPNSGFYQVGPVQRVEKLSILGVVVFNVAYDFKKLMLIIMAVSSRRHYWNFLTILSCIILYSTGRELAHTCPLLESGLGFLKAPPIKILHFLKKEHFDWMLPKMRHSERWRLSESDPWLEYLSSGRENVSDRTRYCRRQYYN